MGGCGSDSEQHPRSRSRSRVPIRPSRRASATSSYLAWTFQEKERELVDLWMEHIPEGCSPIEWYRAWNDGYPTEEDVEIYNEYHPDEPIDLVEE